MSFALYCLEAVLKMLRIVVPLLIAVAYFTLVERKVMGKIQKRTGPNVVGAYGLLQPLADGLKLLLKETVLPRRSNVALFLIAPVLTFTLALVGWAVLPVGDRYVFADVNLGVLYLFAVSSLGVYGIILSGWARNSQYPFLGALRSAAQMVSYEVRLGFILITVLLCVGSLNLTAIVEAQQQVWFMVPLLPMFVLFFISALAETNRHPFDLPEAESELVSGYNTEYSAMGFALFFLGEYGNMLLMCRMTTILFMGGWLSPIDMAPFTWVPGPIWFGLKVCIFVTLFVWARAAYPRYRFNQLMDLGWKRILPLSLGWLLLTGGILMAFNWLPA